MADDGRARVAAWLEAWDCQRLHRTGTAGDAAGAEWLMREAAKLGAAPYCEEFPLSRLDPVAAYLEIEGETIAGVPVFDAPATSEEGILGRLGAVGGDATIGVAELSPQAVYTPAYREMRRTARHNALVIVCQGAHPGLGLLNAEEFRKPYGSPAIHLPSEARETVLAAAARGAQARLVAASRRTPAKACNVVVATRRARSVTAAGRRYDATQLVVAIDRRTRRRAGLLARDAPRAERRAARLRCGLHRQQRPRTRPSRPRRIPRPPPLLGAPGSRRRRALGSLRGQSGCRRRLALGRLGARRFVRPAPPPNSRATGGRPIARRPSPRRPAARPATSIAPAAII